ncbi:MAG: amidohydrolase family protein [Acidimicrobiia bacterium]|nr:amidohydrolase family protein [Acidimicrobiia bacterium]
MGANLVIRGGTVVDGSGEPGRLADVAVTGGVISEIGHGLDGDRVLDASGHVVAPGFVDVHTHYDAQVFWDPALTPSSWHGVTTVIAGNCGFTLAPCRPEHRGLLARTLEHVEDMSLATLEAGVPWDFETFPELLDSIERRGTVLNYGSYVGHTAVRLYVMGDDGYERAATDDELARMAGVVREALLAGAMGFATTSAPTHAGDGGRPVPSRLADRHELEVLIAPMGELQRGVAEMVIGDHLKHADVYELQRTIGRPITWTALLTIKGFPYHEDVAAMHAARRAEGVDVWPQITCRPLVFQMNMAEPFTFNVVPIFAELLALPLEARVERYRDPQWRRRAQEELDRGRFLRTRWDSVSVAETTTHPELVGRPVSEVAAEQGVAPLDVVLDVALSEDLRTRFDSVLANDDPDGIAWLLQQEGMLLGLSDAGAHVSQICDACLPTDLLGGWVRERGVLPLERAVRKLTGEPADVFSLAGRGTGRGYLRPGCAADVTVFDPDEVGPGPLRRVQDFPARGERLVADRPTGMRHVIVNGTPIRVDGEPDERGVAARPGRLLRA